MHLRFDSTAGVTRGRRSEGRGQSVIVRSELKTTFKRAVKLDWFNQSSLHNWDWKNAVSPHFLHKPTSNARGYRIKTGSKELGAGEGDHNSADQR